MIKELHRKPKITNLSLLNFFSKNTNSSTKSEVKVEKVKKEGDSVSISNSITIIEDETEESLDCITKQSKIESTETSIITKKEKKLSSQSEDFFDDFDVENVDLLFLSQQRWIERCLEAEKKYLESQDFPEEDLVLKSQSTSSLPSTDILTESPLCGKKRKLSSSSDSDLTPKRKQQRLPNFFKKTK